MNKQKALDDLATEIMVNNVCRELHQDATRLVFGSGNPNAEIVVIGEAPGKQEDISGEPFVGASGKFLNEMLARAGLKRDDIYITNIVKYRPPNNRDPTSDEKNEFWPYLLRQLEIIKPKIIVTLGRHSGMAFIPELVISRDHGVQRPIRLGTVDYTVIPLYHPAAALYNGSMRQVLMSDFESMVDLTKGNKK
jgi:DNA polymerase